ncbi:MAG: lysylphosphatidylglycerol synthase transmembrane domain-containing protein [Elusimicrobiota bacterium]
MKRKVSRAVMLAVGLGVMAWLLAQVNLRHMGQLLKNANMVYMALGLAMMYLQFHLSAMRWNVLLRFRGIRVPLHRLVNSYLAGNFVSSFLPSRYCGDVYRAYDVGVASGRAFDSAAAVFLERLTGLLVLVSLGFGASLFSRDLTGDWRLSFLITAAYGALFIGVWLVFSEAAHRALVRLLAACRLARLAEAVVRFHAAVASYRGEWALFTRISLLSLLFYAQAFCIVYVSAAAVHARVPWLYIAQVVPLVFVLEALPISINGLGVREGVLTFFLVKFGLPVEQALAVSLVLLLFRLVFTAWGGAIFLGGILSKKADLPVGVLAKT